MGKGIPQPYSEPYNPKWNGTAKTCIQSTTYSKFEKSETRTSVNKLSK